MNNNSCEYFSALHVLIPPSPFYHDFHLIPLPPSTKREGDKMQIINVLNPSPLGEGFRVRWISKKEVGVST
jgi:hypothetical protein